MTHTKTPWTYKHDGRMPEKKPKPHGWFVDSNGRAIFWVEHEADAARIVACINACDGIDNAALDVGVIAELVEAAQRISDHHKLGDLTIHTGLAALSLCNLQNALAKLGQTP